MKRFIFFLIFLLFLAVEVKATKVQYFGSTWEEACDVGVCTRTLYSGVRNIYEDNRWKPIEEAKSLKNVWKKVYLEKDKDFDIEILEVNYTFLVLNFTFNSSNWEQYPECADSKVNDIKCDFKLTTKYEWIDENGIKQKEEEKFQYKYQLKDGVLKEGLKFTYKGNPLNRTYTFGGNSTTIQLQDADSENLEDTFVNSTGPDANYGSNTLLYISNGTQNIVNTMRSYIKFNLSSLPPGHGITNATLTLMFGFVDDEDKIELFHSYNQTWSEESITWNDQPCGITFNPVKCNATSISYYSGGWQGTVRVTSLNIKNFVKKDYENGNKNFSLMINSTSISTYRDAFFSKEYSTTDWRPYLNITYLLNSTVGEVKTLNLTGLSETIFRWDKTENVTVRANVTHTYGRDKLNVTLIEIRNPAGTAKVNNATMKNISSITDGYVYEYNYTLPDESASEGIWTVKIYANDTTNFWGNNSTTFIAGQISKSVPTAIQGDVVEGTNVSWTMKSVVINNTMNKRFVNEAENITTLPTCAYNSTIILLHPNGTSYPYYSNATAGFMNWTIDVITASQIQRWNLTYYTPAPTEDKINEWISGGYWYYSFNATGASCVDYTDVDYTVTVASNASEFKLYVNTTGTPTRVDTDPDWNWVVSGTTASFTVSSLSNKTLYIQGLTTISGEVADTTAITQTTDTPSPFQIIEWRETHHICNPNQFEVEWDEHKIYVPSGSLIARWDDVEQREIYHDIYGDYFLVDESFDADSCEDHYLDFTTEGVSSSEEYDYPDYIAVGELPKVYIKVDLSNPTRRDIEDVELSIQVRYGKDVKLYDRDIIVWENAPEEEFKYYKLRDYSISGAETRIYNIVYTVSKVSAGATRRFLVFFKLPLVEVLHRAEAPEVYQGIEAMKRVVKVRNNAPTKYDSVKAYESAYFKSIIKCIDNEGKFLECSGAGGYITVELGSLDGLEEMTYIIYYEVKPSGIIDRVLHPLRDWWDGVVKWLTEAFYNFLLFIKVY